MHISGAGTLYGVCVLSQLTFSLETSHLTLDQYIWDIVFATGSQVVGSRMQEKKNVRASSL